jgi:hypothetical protein
MSSTIEQLGVMITTFDDLMYNSNFIRCNFRGDLELTVNIAF